MMAIDHLQIMLLMVVIEHHRISNHRTRANNLNGNLPAHHLNATKYFITEQKCDPNSRGQYGRTPLHQASQGGHMNIIEYLIIANDGISSSTHWS